MLGPVTGEHFEVWPDNWLPLRLFLDCTTQWRVASGAGGMVYLGLDYQALESVMRFNGVPLNSPEIIADIQVLEMEALKALNE